MAYDQNTDYKAIIDALEKKKKASLSAAEQSAIQAEIDAATQSRTEKIASDLDKYGKYADSGTLNNVFTYQAGQSIGSQYEQAAKQLGASYDEARQSANNDALNRGMARSSFVSDRLAGLTSKEADARSALNENKATAIYNAANQLRNAYDTKQANALAQEKADFVNTLGAYSNDYMAQINKVTNDGDKSNDWQLPYLQAARNQKIAAMEEAKAAAAQQQFENQLAAARVYNSGSSGGGGGGGYKATETAEPTYGGFTQSQLYGLVKEGMMSMDDYKAMIATPDGATPTTPPTPTPTNGNVYPVSGLTAGGKQAYTLIGAPSADGKPSQYTAQQAEQMLTAYLSRGAITENDFITLMNVFGLDVNKYMS